MRILPVFRRLEALMFDMRQHRWPLDGAELESALRLVLVASSADMGILMLQDGSDGELRPAALEGLTEAQCDILGAHHARDGPFAEAMNGRRLVRVRHAWRSESPLRDFARALGARAVEILPLPRRESGAFGAVCLVFRSHHGSRRSFSALGAASAELVCCALTHAEAQERIESERRRLARTSEAKSQFFAQMSHELRTPLQSIMGYVDLLRAGVAQPLAPTQCDMLDRIAASERLLVRVIDDLITYARIEAGHVTYNIRPVPVDGILRTVESVVAPLARDHGLRLEVNPCAAAVAVSADSDKLNQILVNLATNAVKFTPAGGTVSMSCRHDLGWATFDIADTGSGIARDRLDDIFDPYVQVGAAGVDHLGGFGLGLAISREFALAMGGTLMATSEAGRGSVFSLRLPVSDAVSADLPVVRRAS
ncbi:MAG: sensor histidine kinase [Gemmatimonadales bacterium]